VLRYQHDLSYDEIAIVSGDTVASIKSILYRIRERLRQILVSETCQQSADQSQIQNGGSQ
jgi:DNA-directed RNA polymerase specialized sigma24 family protein